MNEAHTFVETIYKQISNEINKIHTAFPAKVIKYNSGSGTVDIQPMATVITTDGEEHTYPTIYNVPVLMPKVGNVEIAYPIHRGDGCLVICSEQALDYWKSNGIAEAEAKFALSNAIAIIGLFSGQNSASVTAQSENAVVVKNGSVEIVAKGSKIVFKGNLEVQGDITATGDITAHSGI